MPVKTENSEDVRDFTYYVLNEETGEYEPVGKIEAGGVYYGEQE